MDDQIQHQPPLDKADIALRYVCAVLPMLFYGAILMSVVSRNQDRLVLALVDAGLGVAALVLMRWRRRWPLPIALVTAALTAFSTTASGPAHVAYVSLCTHRRWRQIAVTAVVSWLSLVAIGLYPSSSTWDGSTWNGIDQPTLITVVTGTVVLGGLTVFGLYLRGRRDLAISHHQAALTAEREQLQRIEQAKLIERAKIAQEMHDVLAHRISLLSMLAGGLAYRTNLSQEEIRKAALSIQENAHQSLNELRTVLGTLRPAGGLEAPQPTLAHVDALFDEVRTAGQQVDVDATIEDRDLLPTQTGRHAYRIVQEALTNARKHAPGCRVTVELGGRPGDGLHIRVSNPTPLGPSAGPGGRLGLVGLAERTGMVGGTISHGVQDGHFVLDAQLPWEATT